jgi:multidrug resistance efflux pump
MIDAVIKETAIQEANQAFSKQVTNQVARITSELNRLEQLLSAGMVDRRVLSEFRYAVDRARHTGWQVEKWLDGGSRELSVIITEERVRCITRMTKQLASELEVEGKELAGMDSLREAIQKLDAVLNKTA